MTLIIKNKLSRQSVGLAKKTNLSRVKAAWNSVNYGTLAKMHPINFSGVNKSNKLMGDVCTYVLCSPTILLSKIFS